MKFRLGFDKSVKELHRKIGLIENEGTVPIEAIKETPEERYKREKKAWYFHESSWYMRDLEEKGRGYDGKGCNQFTGCIPECPYYPEYGRKELGPLSEEDLAESVKFYADYAEECRLAEKEGKLPKAIA